MQMHDMFSEAQVDEKKWKENLYLVLILAKNFFGSFVSLLEPIT